MSLKNFREREWKVARKAGWALLLTAAPFVCAGSDWLKGLLGAGRGVQLAGVNWQEVPGALWPGAGAVVAAGLLLLPFALSTVRIRRQRWAH